MRNRVIFFEASCALATVLAGQWRAAWRRAVWVLLLLLPWGAQAACSTTYTLVAGTPSSLIGSPFSACSISGSTITCTEDVTINANNICVVTSSPSLTINMGSKTLNWDGNNGTLGSTSNPINLQAGTINVNGNSLTAYGNWTASSAVKCSTNPSTVLTGAISGPTNTCTAYIQPAGLTCLTDNFSAASLDPTLWSVSGVGFTPQIVKPNTVSSNRLRLTDAATNRSTYAQISRWFPAANNKIVVEFDYYGWGGSGADGMAVVLSDASISPSPGGYGGSLGYANRLGVDGFGGGWLGIGLDEFGNYPGTGEGRRGYPSGYSAPAGAAVAAGSSPNSIAVRGSGSGQASGYMLLANTGTLATAVKTGANNTDSTTKHRYRITIDNSNSVNTYAKVERDTTGAGTSYVTVVPQFDVRAANSGQAAIPTNMLLSFTASTGSVTNNHEIGNLSVCATTINPVGSSVAASAFECMDGALAQSSYVNRQTTPAGRNPIYTKLSSAAFNLRVVPLTSSGSIEPNYIPPGGSSKNVTVEIFDDSASPRPACNAYSAANRVATQTATLVSGVMTTGNFTIGKAYPKLMCRVTDSTTPASPVYGCSSDQFAVRPGNVTLSTIPTMATPPSASATSTIKAGAPFTLRAATTTAAADGYSGSLSQVASALSSQDPARDDIQQSVAYVGTLLPTALKANATPNDNASYNEVGYLYLAAGAYEDKTYTAVDQNGDCVANSNSVTLSGGKYGCVISTTAAVSLGRFIPDHFSVTAATLTPRGSYCTGGSSFGYMGEPLFATFTLTALNRDGATTKNYAGKFARFDLSGTGASPANLQWRGRDAIQGQVFVNGTRMAINSVSGSWSAGQANNVKLWFTPSKSISSGTVTPDGPFSVDFGLAPTDPDGVILPAADLDLNTDATAGNDRKKVGTLDLRLGKLQLLNAYGSDRLDLPLPLRAQYWNGTGWQTNAQDSCTTIPATAIAFGRYSGALNEAQTGVNTGASVLTLAAGVGKLVLNRTTVGAATKTGSFDVGINMADRGGTNVGNWCGAAFGSGTGDTATTAVTFTGPSGTQGLDYLGNNSCSADYSNDPLAKATFGVFKSPLIYRRENY